MERAAQLRAYFDDPANRAKHEAFDRALNRGIRRHVAISGAISALVATFVLWAVVFAINPMWNWRNFHWQWYGIALVYWVNRAEYGNWYNRFVGPGSPHGMSHTNAVVVAPLAISSILAFVF